MKAVSKFVFVVATAILPTITSASVETLNFSCSSSLVVSLESGYQASCDGDFSFESGVLENDTAIVLRAEGLLTIGHQVLLKSPLITLDAGGVGFFGTANITPTQLLTPKIELAQDTKFILAINTQTRPAVFQAIPELSSGAILTTGSDIYLAGIGVGSYHLLSDNISPAQGGTLVLSTTGGTIVPMGTSGVSLNPIITATVPEPSNLSMLAMGLFAVVVVVRRKTKNR